MNKRTVLSIIISILCLMNFFAPILDLGIDELSVTYWDMFLEGFFNNKIESSDLKLLMLAPTGILLILTGLHIAEPRSEFVTRDLLAIASIMGFVLYLLIFGAMYGAMKVFADFGDLFAEFITGRDYNSSTKINVTSAGLPAILYPVLFLAYVLVHRFMSYVTPEQTYENLKDSIRPIEDYDESEFV